MNMVFTPKQAKKNKYTRKSQITYTNRKSQNVIEENIMYKSILTLYSQITRELCQISIFIGLQRQIDNCAFLSQMQ